MATGASRLVLFTRWGKNWGPIFILDLKSPLVILKLESAVKRIRMVACALILSACSASCSGKEVARKSPGVNSL